MKKAEFDAAKEADKRAAEAERAGYPAGGAKIRRRRIPGPSRPSRSNAARGGGGGGGGGGGEGRRRRAEAAVAAAAAATVDAEIVEDTPTSSSASSSRPRPRPRPVRPPPRPACQLGEHRFVFHRGARDGFAARVSGVPRRAGGGGGAAAKASLLATVVSTNIGRDCDADQLRAVLEATLNLEALNPTNAPGEAR